MSDASTPMAPGGPFALPDQTGQAVSDWLGFSPRWLSKLVDQGFVERKENGLFDPNAVCQGYIRWLKDPERRTAKTEGAKALEAEKLRSMRIDNAKKLGQLVDFDLVEAFFAESMVELRNTFGGIPAGVTRDPELRKKLEDRLNAAFAQYHAAFDRMAAAGPPGASDADQLDEDDE